MIFYLFTTIVSVGIIYYLAMDIPSFTEAEIILGFVLVVAFGLSFFDVNGSHSYNVIPTGKTIVCPALTADQASASHNFLVSGHTDILY